ncbi:MAG: hypothetical protein GWN62_08250 [Aliifodinibius sp.]|nr:hypothetical protein [Fodinibius sp.]
MKPKGRGNNRAIHPGGYHKPESGFAAKGYPLNILGDQSGTSLSSMIVRWINNALG